METSVDKLYWENDASYKYYKHGPLARTILGETLVQGIDYAYTLQGWLKGVNSSAAGNGTFDIGQDGILGSSNSLVARDAYSFSLNYFGNDYKPINASTPFVTNIFGLTNADAVQTAKPLYNGNIASMCVNIPKLVTAQVYGYKYDQLNRLVGMDAFTGNDNGTNSFTAVSTQNYKERISYDANGNIGTYLRNGSTAGSMPQAMDNLTYQYGKDANGKITSNKLRYVHDQVADGNYSEDIDKQTPLTLTQVQAENLAAQASDNYKYDEIGNLVHDEKENISSIEWTVYGKIKSISKTNGSTITYSYDASGNRISKELSGGKKTYYVRDASGNVMSVYESGISTVNGGDLTQTELHLYGSSRLGIYSVSTDVQNCLNNTDPLVNFIRGNKFFELSNHLGNVLATISDKKIAVPKSSPNQTQVDYYTAYVVTANDYYPFGMNMPGRKYIQPNSNYRYGFNGKENDNDVKGEGNQQDYGFRIYDPRLARFLSIDPLTQSYPWYTPYQFAGNKPIAFVDIDGLEEGSLEINTRRREESYLNNKITSQQYSAQTKAAGAWGTLASVAAVDAFLTRGRITSFLYTSVFLGHLHHNGTNDPLKQKQRADDLKGDGAGFLLGYGIGKIIGGVFRVITPSKTIKVDLMGGSETKYEGFINYDKAAVAGGINDDVKSFGKYFGKNTVSEVVVNNPQAAFVEEISSALKSDGIVTVRGTMSNKYFKEIYNGKAKGLEDFNVVQVKPTETKGFKRTDGAPVQGEIIQLRLTKKHK